MKKSLVSVFFAMALMCFPLVAETVLMTPGKWIVECSGGSGETASCEIIWVEEGGMSIMPVSFVRQDDRVLLGDARQGRILAIDVAEGVVVEEYVTLMPPYAVHPFRQNGVQKLWVGNPDLPYVVEMSTTSTTTTFSERTHLPALLRECRSMADSTHGVLCLQDNGRYLSSFVLVPRTLSGLDMQNVKRIGPFASPIRSMTINRETNRIFYLRDPYENEPLGGQVLVSARIDPHVCLTDFRTIGQYSVADGAQPLTSGENGLYLVIEEEAGWRIVLVSPDDGSLADFSPQLQFNPGPILAWGN